MIDEHFSSQKFEKLGLDTEATRNLADALASVIQQEIKPLVEKKLEESVRKLNSMNHCFKLHENEFDYISYCETLNRNDTYNLKISIDLIVATGYAHLISNDEDEA